MNQMKLYYEKLKDINGIKLRSFKSYCSPVHWLMTLTLDDKYDRDDFLKYMNKKGVDCRQMVNPVHHALHFSKCFDENNFPVSIQVSKQSVHLPSSTFLSIDKIHYIAKIVIEYFN